MANVLSYKCPTCGEPLTYSPENNVLLCSHCDNTFKVEDIANSISDSGGTSFDWSDYKESIPAEEIPDTTSYVCKSCGAEIVTDGTTIATKCPYCDNVVVVSDKVGGVLKPNGIIPFKVKKSELKNMIANYYKGKYFLPKGFISENKIRETQGVYVPFWLYDCHADGDVSFKGQRVEHWSDSDYNYTKTSHYLINCDGEMSFSKIPVDGSVKMDDDLMDSIEPFNYDEILDFNSGYLSGFLADRFDADAGKVLPRATERIKKSVSDVFISSMRGAFSSVTPVSSNIQISDTKIKYVLLPVYIIKSKYKDKEYTFAINGQTGKVVGNLPFLFSKVVSLFFGLSLIPTFILGLIYSIYTIVSLGGI